MRLHDPDAGRVALVKAFCEKFARSRGAEMSFVETPDLDRSLDGADFVITTFRIGGLKSLALDESLPPLFGYYGEETAGPGGLFMAMRTVPVILDVARRMERGCPRAWLINYANPTNFLGDALQRSGYRRWVSLCDGYTGPPRTIGLSLGLDPARITTRHAGINHCSWVYEATCDGRDLLEEMRRMDSRTFEANLLSVDAPARHRFQRWMEIFRTMGLYPTPSGHVEPYFYYDEWVEAQRERHDDRLQRQEEAEAKKWDRVKAVLNKWDEEAAAEIARTHASAHADLAIGVMAALATDSGEVFPVNVPQRGAVPGFSPETVLELYSKVTSKGFEPQPVPAFPRAVLVQQSHLVGFEELAVTGILAKSRQTLLEALCVHPFTRSLAKARALFETMWKEELEQGALGPYWAS
jgi:6-phospho-beta-glucosidase